VSEQTLAELSNGFVYASMGVLTLALVAYAVELAFGSRGRASSEASARRPEPAMVGATGAVGDGPADEAPPPVREAGPQRQRQADKAGGIAWSLTWLGFLLLLAGVVFRGLAAGRAPWGNMYEFSCTVALVVLGVYLVVATRRPSLRYLGVFVVLPVLLTLGLAVAVLYVPAGPLVPALKSYWLVIHVLAAIISGGVFMVGAVITVLYLLQDHWERRSLLLGTPPNTLSRRLPTSESLDASAYRLFRFVFPLWTFAIVAGAIWAENAWGRYWNWDPKETWALVTWLVFAAYLHARATAGWRGRKAAWLALAGLSCFVFNYFGVNIWFTGLHSYGGLPTS
jgi:cytochrome c-type biogenesis protein CcsB